MPKVERRGGAREGAGRKCYPENNSFTLRGKIQSRVNELHDFERRMRRLVRELSGHTADGGIDGRGVKVADIARLTDELRQLALRHSDTQFQLRGLRRLQEAKLIDETEVIYSDRWRELGISFRF